MSQQKISQLYWTELRHKSPHRCTIYGNEVGLFTGGQMPRVEIKGMSFEKGLRIFRKKVENADKRPNSREGILCQTIND